MPEYERPVAHHVVDKRVAVHVEDASSLATLHEQRVTADRTERPHGAVDAAGYQPDGSFHQPCRTVHGEKCPRVYAPSATLQTRQPPSLRLIEVYRRKPIRAVTKLTPDGEPTGRTCSLSTASGQAEPGEDQQASDDQKDCTHHGPER